MKRITAIIASLLIAGSTFSTYSTITLSWDDTARSLTIGRRHGSFDGMEKTRTFTVNVLGEEKTAVYNGKETVVSF